MVFFHARIIFIILSVIYCFAPLHGYPSVFFFTFLQGLILLISFYGTEVARVQQKKTWEGMFCFVFMSVFVAAQYASSEKYVLFATASFVFISFFFIDVDDDRHMFTINSFFWPFVVSAILTIAFISFVNFRWETVDELNFSIDNHYYVVEYFTDDDFSHCEDLREYGWMYYRDRVTGLTKAEKEQEDREDPVLIIYEEPRLKTIGIAFDIIAWFAVAITALILYIYISQNLNREYYY